LGLSASDFELGVGRLFGNVEENWCLLRGERQVVLELELEEIAQCEAIAISVGLVVLDGKLELEGL